MPNSPIKTAADLKGKKFGISNPKSLGEMMGVLVMEKAGLKQGDVQMTALGSLGGALTALENGVVDVTSIPLILFRTRGGEKQVPRPGRSEGAAAHPVAARHGHRRGDQEESPTSCARIQAARREGTKFIYEHTDEAIKILSKTLRAAAAEGRRRSWSRNWSRRSSGPKAGSRCRCSKTPCTAMKDVGMLDKDVDLKKHRRQLVPAGRPAKMTATCG